MELEIPPDALIVLIGPAGCGKSTFAARHFLRTQIVASDECRALVSDDESSSAASADAFKLMHVIIGYRLKRGRLTVADATNVHGDKREQLLAIAGHWKRPAVAVVFDLAEDECQAWNRMRDRVLPPQAIRAQLRALHASQPALEAEGFVAVWTLRSSTEVEEAAVGVLDVGVVSAGKHGSGA